MQNNRIGKYTKAGRLQDVMALIQVLGFDPHTHRSLSGIEGELQCPPRSAGGWLGVLEEHPEFFRVARQGDHPVSLVARHVTPRDGDGARPMDQAFVAKLLDTAINMHDRAIRRHERWIPMLGVIVSGLITGAVAILTTVMTIKHVTPH